jgi:hypothetical protein
VTAAGCARGHTAAHVEAFRAGLAVSLPVELLPLWSAEQLEEVVAGRRAVTLAALQSIAEYRGGLRGDAPPVTWLWATLATWDARRLAGFLEFVAARSRLPAALDALRGALVIKGDSDRPRDALPTASTCFLTLHLGPYSSEEKLAQALAFACANCRSMTLF